MNDTTDKSFEPSAKTVLTAPDTTVDVRETFGIDIDWQVPAFSKPDERTPDLDENYVFDPDTTLAILAGFAHDRRVMVQGYHGTGKSTHIEQVAARLKWPCIRINLDAHISRIDLIGRDADLLDRAGEQMVHVELDRVSPLAVPVMVMIGREATPQGAVDDELLLEAESLIVSRIQHETDSNLRAQAIAGPYRGEAPGVLDALLQASWAPDTVVRAAAAQALGKVPGTAAAERLRDLHRSDPEGKVRRKSAAALRQRKRQGL